MRQHQVLLLVLVGADGISGGVPLVMFVSSMPPDGIVPLPGNPPVMFPPGPVMLPNPPGGAVMLPWPPGGIVILPCAPDGGMELPVLAGVAVGVAVVSVVLDEPVHPATAAMAITRSAVKTIGFTFCIWGHDFLYKSWSGRHDNLSRSVIQL